MRYILICPEGAPQRWVAYGPFDSEDEAAQWGYENRPNSDRAMTATLNSPELRPYKVQVIEEHLVHASDPSQAARVAIAGTAPRQATVQIP
jgi:hypothetical protein